MKPAQFLQFAHYFDDYTEIITCLFMLPRKNVTALWLHKYNIIVIIACINNNNMCSFSCMQLQLSLMYYCLSAPLYVNMSKFIIGKHGFDMLFSLLADIILTQN